MLDSPPNTPASRREFIMSQSASMMGVSHPWRGLSLYQVGILLQATWDSVCSHGEVERIVTFEMRFCPCLLKNLNYQILFCFSVTFCTCAEGRCFRPVGHLPGIPTVGSTVAILLTTLLVIGECNLSDSRISVLVLRNISSPKGLL